MGPRLSGSSRQGVDPGAAVFDQDLALRICDQTSWLRQPGSAYFDFDTSGWAQLQVIGIYDLHVKNGLLSGLWIVGRGFFIKLLSFRTAQRKQEIVI